MAGTYSSLIYHIVFSTKMREPWISQDIEQSVWSYIGAIADQHGMTPLGIGGIDDHLHVVVAIPATMAVSRAVQMLKGGSSRWIRTTFPHFEGFGWQNGYGAFSVSRSRLESTLDYVARQRERHEGWSFELEYETMLDRHRVEYDATHLLD